MTDFEGMPFTAVAQALSRLSRQGVIQRLGKGLYYRSRPTAFGDSKPNLAQIRSLPVRRRGEASELSPEKTVGKLLEYFREPGRFERLLKVAESEPPRVRAMLGAIGQQLGQPEQRLAPLRKSLNPLSRFDFGILSVLEHASQWQAKERNKP